jgi:chromosome segregation ATPase
MPLLTVEIRPTFTVPSVYQTGSTEEIEEALALGAFVQAHVHTQRSTVDIKALQERREAERSQLIAVKDSEVAKYTGLVQELRERLSALQSEYAEYKQSATDATAAAAKTERQRTLQEMEDRIQEARRKQETAEERRAALEISRASDLQAVEDRTRALLQHTLAVREEQVHQSQAALAVLQNAYRNQVEELKALNDHIRRKTANVKTKGNEYEQSFRDSLVRAYGILDRFALVDSARNGIGHAGDFLVQMGEHKTLWEVKDYDKPVPRSEVEKFQRDMLEHKDIRIGVMVSRGTEIVGKTAQGDRGIEFVEGKLLVYLSRFEALGEDVNVLQSLLPLFHVWWEASREEEQSDTLIVGIKELERLWGDLSRKRQEWRVHKTRMEEILRWMTEAVEDTEDRVEALLRLLRSGTVDTTEIPETIFRPAHLDEKIRDTVHHLLEVFEVEETSEIRLSELAESLASRKKVSKSTASQYIMASLLDSVVHKSPGKSTMVRGLRLKHS